MAEAVKGSCNAQRNDRISLGLLLFVLGFLLLCFCRSQIASAAARQLRSIC